MVLQYRVTGYVQHITILIVLKALGTKRNTLIKRNVVANNSGLANNHTCTVVDGKILTNLSTWVNIDTRLRMCQLCDDTRYDGHVKLVKFVSHTIVSHGVHRRITENNLTIIGRSRVVIEHRLYVGIKQAFDLWQCIDKCQSLLLGLAIYLILGAFALTMLTELKSVRYLLGKQLNQLLHSHTNMVCTYSLIGLPLLEIVGEDNVLYQSYDALNHINRWQRSYCGWHHAYLFF